MQVKYNHHEVDIITEICPIPFKQSVYKQVSEEILLITFNNIFCIIHGVISWDALTNYQYDLAII